MGRLVLMLGLVVVLATGCGAADVEAREAFTASPDLLALVPQGALGFVQAPSCIALDVALGRLQDQVDDGDRRAVDSLGEILESLGAMQAREHVDRSRPLAFAFTAADGSEPVPTIILPVKDAAAFRAAFPGFPTDERGDYVAVSMGPGYQPGGGNSLLVEGLPGGDVAARFDLAGLIEAYRMPIDMGLGMVQMIAVQGAASGSNGLGTPPGMDMAALMGAYVDMLHEMLDSAQGLDLGVNVTTQDVRVSGRFKAAAGSLLAGFGKGPATDLSVLASRIDPDQPLQFLMAGETDELVKRFEPFFSSILSSMNWSEDADYAELLAAQGALAAIAGNAISGHGSFDEGGMQFAMFFSPSDSRRFLDGYASFLELDGATQPGATMHGPVTSEMAGVTVTEYRQEIDWDVYGQAMGMPDLGGTDPAAMSRAMFGGDDIVVRFLSHEQDMAVVMGPDEAFLSDVVRRLRTSDGELDDELAVAVAELQGANPAMYFRMDVSSFLGSMSGVMRSIDPAAAQQFGALGDTSAPFAIRVGCRDRDWDFGLQVDVAGFAEIGKAGR